MTRELLVKDLKSYKFIFVWEEETLREVADRLKEAYDRLKSLDVSVSWYQAQESLSSKVAHFPTVFVMNRFDTNLYKELKEDYRIISPICVITSLNYNVEIPFSSCRSLANMALSRCRVTSISFSEEQTSLIRERVSLMGGEYTQYLLANTTRLISEEVHSQKYDSTVDNGIAVVLCSWLDEAWVSSSSNPNSVAVNHSYTKKHRCPVFLKCNVVVSGFIEEERDEIVKLLKSNPANYTKEIVMDGDSQTTHLVAKQAVNDKLKITHERHIIVVTKDWITDCVKHACRLPEENYSLEFKQNKEMTVARQKRKIFSDVIPEKLNKLNFELNSCGEFLGGCNIYLCGFTDTQTNSINKFLNLYKATRLSKLNATVTHVVVGCPTDKQSHEVANFSPAPSFALKYDWLIECWKQQSALSESDFIVKVSEIDKPSKKARNKKYVEGSDADNKLYLPELSQLTKEDREEKILSNSNFWLIDPLPSMLDQIKRTIIDNGGNLVTKYSAITLDYVIVPLDFDNSITNPLDFDNSITNTTMLVTLYWLESSLFAKRLLDPFEDPLFTPANGFGCRNILSGTTVMVAKERDRSIKLISIEQFLSYLGARVTNKLIDIVPVHVVISDDPNHELARKAKELDVPVVRLKWMFQCAHTNTKLPFADFYTYPSSQYSDSPPASNTSFTSCRSFFECDPTFLDFEDPERYSPPGTTPKTASFDPHNNFGGVIVEKCVEPEMREAWELMDTTQSPSSNDTLLNFDFNVEPADNKGNTSISVDYNTPNFIHGNITHSRGKKRLRSPTTPEYGNPRNRNLFNVVISGPEPNDTDNDTISEPIEEVGQNTQEVFDKFQNILYQELNEAEKQINKPHDKMMIGQNAEFKVSSESLRFSSSIQQKKYLLEHHSKLSHTRAEIIWDPFHSEGYSPLPSSTPDTIGNTFSSSTPEQSHSSEEISSKSRCNTLQRSGSWKADSNSSLKSSLYSSPPSQSYIYVFMY